MFQNYLKVAIRNLLKHPVFSGVNILGLTLGIACCMAIGLFVRHELSYDVFHHNSDRIVRICLDAELQNKISQYPMIGYEWGPIIAAESPQIEAVSRIFQDQAVQMIVDNERFEETRFVYADSTFFHLFDYEFLAGNPETALLEPNGLVLSEETAKKYFGTTDIIGKTLQMEAGAEIVEMNVSAVVRQLPVNSHFHFDLIASMHSFENMLGADHILFHTKYLTVFHTYLLLANQSDQGAVEEQLAKSYELHAAEQDRDFLKGFWLQPLADIHLRSNLLGELETNGSMSYVYIFISIAILTLLIACINFMNLTTARSAGRAREVGMRKVIGARKRNLVGQFMGEAFVVALVATGLALLIVELSIPVLNAQFEMALDASFLGDPFLLGALMLLALIVGIVAGSYPALFLSAMQPIEALKGKVGNGRNNGLLRKGLVVVQFAVSIALIIGSGVIVSQLSYIKTMDMGFAKEHRLVIPIQIDNTDQQRVRTIESFRQMAEIHPEILSLTATSNVPGGLRGLVPVKREDAPEEEIQQITTVSVDFDYADAMELEILSGRAFDAGFSTDSTTAFMLNEAAVRAFGFETKSAVGKRLDWLGNRMGNPDGDVLKGTVIGVFKNMHFEPVYREIYPMMFRIEPAQNTNMIASIDPEQVPEAIALLETEWNKRVQSHDFQYTFLDEKLAEIYTAEDRLGKIVSFFTLLAIIIACLGLFALSAFTAEKRYKEIGIRKVLGASIWDIVFLVSKEFSVLVLIAFVLAIPLAWFAMNHWLEGFFYHTDISLGIFAWAGILAISIAWLTVSFQSVKAGMMNPVHAIRAE